VALLEPLPDDPPVPALAVPDGSLVGVVPVLPPAVLPPDVELSPAVVLPPGVVVTPPLDDEDPEPGLPLSDVVPSDGRHSLADWHVSPSNSPGQGSPRGHGPLKTTLGGLQHWLLAMQPSTGRHASPPEQSPSFSQATAMHCAPQWVAVGSLPGGQSVGGRGTTSARAPPAGSNSRAASGQTRDDRDLMSIAPDGHCIIRGSPPTASCSRSCCSSRASPAAHRRRRARPAPAPTTSEPGRSSPSPAAPAWATTSPSNDRIF
jgi:hypothetical protein